MLQNKIIAAFSKTKKHYDLITIGPYANKSAKLIQLMSKNTLKVLTVTPNPTQI